MNIIYCIVYWFFFLIGTDHLKDQYQKNSILISVIVAVVIVVEMWLCSCLQIRPLSYRNFHRCWPTQSHFWSTTCQTSWRVQYSFYRSCSPSRFLIALLERLFTVRAAFIFDHIDQQAKAEANSNSNLYPIQVIYVCTCIMAMCVFETRIHLKVMPNMTSLGQVAKEKQEVKETIRLGWRIKSSSLRKAARVALTVRDCAN